MPSVLPPPFEEVTIPATFSVTAIASAGACRLRMVLASLPRSPSALPAGPHAELGSLGHAVLERVARGHGDPFVVFEASLRETKERLEADPTTSSYSDLAGTFGLPAWSRFRADVLARCAQISPRMPRERLATSAAPSVAGLEKTITSEKLRLKGRLDKVVRTREGSWQVTDHKLGQVRDRSGLIRREIALQLTSYGLLLSEREPSADIRLVVNDGQEHEIPFGPRDRVKARREIRRAWRGLEPERRVRAIDIAMPGEQCADCRFRHRCAAYLITAPTWWRLNAATPGELAKDTWGAVLVSERDVSGWANVTVRDVNGRNVRIDRLDGRHTLDASIVGRTLWFFDLESTVRRRSSDGKSIQPTTFHEHAADSAQRRAWDLSVFRSE